MKNKFTELSGYAENLFDKETILKRVKNLTAGQIIFRVFSAWILICLFNMVFRKPFFTDFSYFKSIGLLPFLLEIILAFVIMFFLFDDKILRFVTVGEIFLCALSGAVQSSKTKQGDFFFFAGLCLGVAVVTFLTKTDDIKKSPFKIKPAAMWIFAGLIMIFFTAFVGGFCCLYYKNHWTSCYDFGIFSQMFYYMKETGLPLTTCERDGLLSHFAVHFSPVYYLLLPVYMLIPSPCTLLVMQALVVASSIIPMILICKKLGLSNPASLCFGGILVLYPPFAGGCFTYLHENCFLTPFILWFIYSELGNKKIHFVLKFVFAFSVLLVKEDACVYVAVIALYFFCRGVSQKDKNAVLSNIIIFAFAIIYFLSVAFFLQSSGEGVMSWRYKNYNYDDSGSLVTLIIACVKNPVYVINQCFTEEKIKFILQMFIPLGFLPFISRKVSHLILLIPFVLVNLMSDYAYQSDIGFQYCFGSGAILLYLSAVNYSELINPMKARNIHREWNVRKLMISAVCASMIIFTGLYWERTDYIKVYRENSAQREIIDRGLETIPENASVAASTFIVPDLSQRKEIYQLETTKKQAEYYVLDLRYESDEYYVEEYDNDDFKQVFFEKDVIGIYKRK